MFKSPLRYPGSKAKVWKLIAPYFNEAVKYCEEYREPFLGGGSIFLSGPDWQRSWINDSDEDIAILFKVMRDNPDELCALVDSEIPSVESWKRWKLSAPSDPVLRAFRTLFLNRTNFSGILKGRPIGGFKQESDYPIGCRWNPITLKKRIEFCSKKLQHTEITSDDFYILLTKSASRPVFLFLDPPYYHKGNSLYNEMMSDHDHERLRDALVQTPHKFLLTYDDCEEIRKLYNGYDLYFWETSWHYSITTGTVSGRKGNELFISNFPVPGVTKLLDIAEDQVG